MKDSIIFELYEEAVSRAELIVPEGSEYMEACERSVLSEYMRVQRTRLLWKRYICVDRWQGSG